jgi:peptide/nickel transport system ATP-binding protein
MSEPILEATALHKTFGGGGLLGGRPATRAVQDVSLAVHAGETLGIVGESGCGKSTLARLLVGLDRPTQGELRLHGQPIATARGRALRGAALRDLRRRVQLVFQDPTSSLNPRKTVGQILAAPLRHLAGLPPPARKARVATLMEQVRLRPEFVGRYPHEFSGGQAQRIGIARALAAASEVIVLDEPVSALDVSVQAQILNLLDDLKAELGLTYVFISHDLAVVRQLADRVAVMYQGRIVEQGPTAQLFRAPRHPYTRLLLDSIPGARPWQAVADTAVNESVVNESVVEAPPAPLGGCAFAPRCPRALPACRLAVPELAALTPDHRAACLNPEPNSLA